MKSPNAICNLASLPLSQLAWRCRGVERVMGIQPMRDSSWIITLSSSGQESATEVREFAVGEALQGEVRQ